LQRKKESAHNNSGKHKSMARGENRIYFFSKIDSKVL
jgi:hypothetical protein